MIQITMNLINNIILLIILLALANYLSNGSIINVLLKYYEIIKTYIFGNNIDEDFRNSSINRSLFNNKITRNVFPGMKEYGYTTPTIVHDSDFKYVYDENQSMLKFGSEDDPIMKKLYYFLQGLVGINHNFEDINPSGEKEMNLNQSENDLIRKFLNKSLNSNDFKFTNLQILDNLTYFDNNGDKIIKPFQIYSDVYLNENYEVGKISLYIEMFLKYNELFNGPIKSGTPVISRIKFTGKKQINIPLPINDSENISEFESETQNSLDLNTITFTEANQEETTTFSE